MEKNTEVLISATEPDWSREKAIPGRYEPWKYLLASIRTYQRLKMRKDLLSRFASKFVVLRHRFWSAVCGADIPINAMLGGGLMMPHPNGIAIHPGAEIGPNCLILQQVTIGANTREGLPVVGGHVDIGSGAKILGKIRIGNHVRIGANAVVVKDIPSNTVAAGVPARVMGKAY